MKQEGTDFSKQINILGEFCGMRDVTSLTQQALRSKFGMEQADIMVLFGGSILCGGDVLAEAIREKVAKKYIIVGGAGHTTQTLRDRMKRELPQMDTEGKTEAWLFAEYIRLKYNLEPDFLECESTNCGNNITYLLKLIADKKLACKSIILSQDATMQRRMYAVLKKYEPELLVINYATYNAEVVWEKNEMHYANQILGMWDMDRYISLLMGEIPRLTDDENGYGPQGKDFIAHMDIPQSVQEAFADLKKEYEVREANPLYASR